MSALDWSTLPLLPLTCILNHLSTEDAMRAVSTCRHWRNALLLFEGRRDLLKLNIKQLEKCRFLVSIFKKHARKVHLYIDCNEPEIEKFMHAVFPLFFETQHLQELLFIGPSFVQQSTHIPAIQLRRIPIEALIYKNALGLKKLGFFGCSLGTPKNEEDRYSHKAVERYSRHIHFDLFTSPENAILTGLNQGFMVLTSITHLIVDVHQTNTQSLKTLAHLVNLRFMTINVTNRKLGFYEPVNWMALEDIYHKPLRVAVNIIGVPYRRFDDIIEKVLVDGMMLVSIKVMFCKSLYTPLISHISRLYQDSLKEVMWVDSPYDSSDPYHRVVRPMRHTTADAYAHVNPFVLMCWQCSQLERLVIHGYWVWQYDVLGFVRLRKDLRQLEVSAIYYKQDRFQNMLNLSEEGAIRVLCGDSPTPIDAEHQREVNEFIDYPWRPTQWSELHPALRGRSNNQQRMDYVVRESRTFMV